MVIMHDRMPTIVCEMLSLGAVLEQHAVEGLDLSSVTERREMAQIVQDYFMLNDNMTVNEKWNIVTSKVTDIINSIQFNYLFAQ